MGIYKFYVQVKFPNFLYHIWFGLILKVYSFWLFFYFLCGWGLLEFIMYFAKFLASYLTYAIRTMCS
jgi:hypothetical protein